MPDLLFEFDQKELKEFIDNSAKEHNIMFSLFSAKEKNATSGKLFLAAQSVDPAAKNKVMAGARIPVGCPVPPGWSSAFIPTITAAKLKNTPGFILPAATKKKLLTNKAPNKQVEVGLESFTNQNSNLEMKLSFKIKDNQGKIASQIDAPVI